MPATAIDTAVKFWMDAYWHFRKVIVEDGATGMMGLPPPAEARAFFDLVPNNLHSTNARAEKDVFKEKILPWMLDLALQRLDAEGELSTLANACKAEAATRADLVKDFVSGHLEQEDFKTAMQFYRCLRDDAVTRILDAQHPLPLEEAASTRPAPVEGSAREAYRRRKLREQRQENLESVLLSLGVLRDSMVNEKLLDAVSKDATVVFGYSLYKPDFFPAMPYSASNKPKESGKLLKLLDAIILELVHKVRVDVCYFSLVSCIVSLCCSTYACDRRWGSFTRMDKYCVVQKHTATARTSTPAFNALKNWQSNKWGESHLHPPDPMGRVHPSHRMRGFSFVHSTYYCTTTTH